MLNHKNYMDISAFQNKYADGFKVGDLIVIQEKVDGANASFQYDKDSDSMMSFSRKTCLPRKILLGDLKLWLI